ncbi:DUF7519 family protein [Halorubrum lacusprofundi]|jgi:hypothetical protein|uniref:Uncharacterized protein n=1 Tax=Halorubrum lacusprofundi (strain ATCC 49239 / DSM 5036 / JCM 8891 / ACAM 34) TaxID=416348 RepID=B9LST9_HALLT|nr:hypothetical protein [Halorubrum lacusprofundi]ACM56004.1 conserved hypothetical protein [Halorubrum lacusprofundi ATCC 49239]
MTASDATGPATVPDGATARFVRRPAITSSVVALAAGGVAVALVADTALQREILRLAVGGALAFGIGARLVRHGGTALRALGALIALGGGLVVLVAVGQAATQSPQVTHRVELLPGIVGMWTLSAALAPVRFRWSRALIDLGAGFVFLGVLVTGVTQGVGTTALLLAALATIVARDAAENAVSVGGQIGGQRGARTVRAELAHVGVAASVGAGAVVVVLGVARLDIDGLPFGALVALIVGSVVLVLGSNR